MADFQRGDQVVCEDGRAGVVDHKHSGVEPGPAGEFYAVRFGALLEWQPADNLHDNRAIDKTAWLVGRAAAAESRSAKAAIDNVTRENL